MMPLHHGQFTGMYCTAASTGSSDGVAGVWLVLGCDMVQVSERGNMGSNSSSWAANVLAAYILVAVMPTAC